MTAVKIPSGWGVDTNQKLTKTSATGLRQTPLSGGQQINFVWRYVSLGAPSPADITEQEVEDIISSDLKLLLVQHVQYPGWASSIDNGIAHGKAAVKHAQLVKYDQGCHLALDMEGVSNPGSVTISYVRAWAGEVHAAEYKVCLYVGYNCGLSPVQLSQLADAGVVNVFWSDFAWRPDPPAYGYACKQHVQCVVAGVTVDPDQCFPDLKGNVLIGMSPDETTETSDPTQE